MGRSKDAWLASGAGDLQEADVEDVPVKGESVRVRGLPAAYSNQAQSEALELKTIGREQVATVATDRLEVLQFHHGVIDPHFTLEESEQISRTFGPAFKRVITKIDELSGVDKEEIEKATQRFPAGGRSQNGSDVEDAAAAGSGGPAVPSRAGAGTQDAGS